MGVPTWREPPHQEEQAGELLHTGVGVPIGGMFSPGEGIPGADSGVLGQGGPLDCPPVSQEPGRGHRHQLRSGTPPEGRDRGWLTG